MLYFSRNKYFAGNICFLVFLVFLFSLAFSTVTNAAQAAVPVRPGDAAPAAPPGGGVQEITLTPTTITEFNTVINDLVTYLETTNDLVTEIVYRQADEQVYEVVYGTVYQIYQHTLWLVYGPPAAGYQVDKQVYNISYNALENDTWKSVTVGVPVPVPKIAGGGGGGGGGGGPTVPDVGDEWEGMHDTSQQGSFNVVTTGESFLDALEREDREQGTILVGVRDLSDENLQAEVRVDPSKVPAEVWEFLKAHPDAEVGYQFEQSEGNMGGLSDDYHVVGDVVTAGLVIRYGNTTITVPGAITLHYGSAAGALRNNLYAALDLVGLNGLAQAGVDEDKLAVYRYNQTTKTWEYLGGVVDKVRDAITVEVSDLNPAQYCLMVYDKTFTDLAGHWSKRDVEIMAAHHIAGGITDDMFSPNSKVTRAQFAAWIIRTLGIPETKPATGSFKDVPATAWYYGAVETAFANQLVAGYGNNEYRPEAEITRQEIAVMIHRALRYAGKNPEARVEALAPFSDSDQVAAWARNGMAVAVGENIVRGRTAATLVPAGTATRAEAIVMLKRLLVSLGRLSW